MGATELQRRPAESRDCFKSFWLTVRLLGLKVGGVKLAVMHGHQIQCHCSPSNDSFFCVISVKTTPLTHFRKLHAFIKLDYKQEIWHRTQKACGLRSALAYGHFGSMKKCKTFKQCLYKHRLIVDSILPRGFILVPTAWNHHRKLSFVFAHPSVFSFIPLFLHKPINQHCVGPNTQLHFYTLVILQRRICENRHLLFVEQKCRIFPLHWTKASLQKPTGHTEGEAVPRRMFSTRS